MTGLADLVDEWLVEAVRDSAGRFQLVDEGEPGGTPFHPDLNLIEASGGGQRCREGRAVAPDPFDRMSVQEKGGPGNTGREAAGEGDLLVKDEGSVYR
jgi:hypothetical protein